LLQHRFGDPAQVQLVGGSLVVISLAFGLPGVDADHQEAFFTNLVDKVFGIRGPIFSAKKHMLGLDATMLASALDFL
jgi:hypothetical protein